MDNLKINVVPMIVEGNLYQSQLSEGLEKLGNQVRGVSNETFFLPAKIKATDADILHLHWLDTFFCLSSSRRNPLLLRLEPLAVLAKLSLSILGLMTLKLGGIKIVWTAHNLKNHENLYPLSDRFFTSFIIKLSDAIITHCEVAKAELVSQFRLKTADKIFTVYHGNYIDCYENKISKPEARKHLAIPDTSLTFLFLGHIRPYKGISELIETYQQLDQRDTCLAIAGKVYDAEMAEQLQQKASDDDNIRFFPGFVPDDQIQVYMNACDVVVFPYRRILTSGAVILAMSFGKACIAPRIGCIGEILSDTGAFLYDVNDSQGLSQALQLAMEYRTELGKMGERNRQTANQWNWLNIAEKTCEVYRYCLER
jgi:glycosyltransferase involved in cell wall biosynthesis